ncbi:ABC-2 family transporter protein [Gemmata sp. SH-PL17]|uniref:ABC transporter permease n=1 Tax=Gemmata sp. SH-PL17 TaxID=1630693 RepID=UPI00078BD56E|nr:ABC transporter permease subunit [Gemmata sp. SH-PL17]AMV23887.1 ABC-2 family transporter protein [Gemmata sp. SH-PL17]
MSSTPPVTTAPVPAAPDVGVLRAPIETAPSAIKLEGPMFARFVGFLGLFLLVLGAVVVVATRVTGQARIVPENWGFLFSGVGIALMLYHAIIDGEQEIRRLYGMLFVAFLVLSVVAAVLPGPFKADSQTAGYFFMPWGIGAAILAILFAIPFVRHETDELLRTISGGVLLVLGAGSCVGALVAGALNPDWLAGPGLALAVLGLGFLSVYLGQVGTDDGIGYTVAVALGAFGGAALFYVFARTVFPTVLFDGPMALRKPSQALDYWKVAGRVAVVVASLILVGTGALGKFPVWLRAVLAGTGLVVGTVFVLGSTGTYVTIAPRPFLIPSGAVLGGIGLVYLAVSLGVCSDNQFVTLVRRELAAYFTSPIGFIVLAGMLLVQGTSYVQFVATLQSGQPMPEPIVEDYGIHILSLIGFILQIPALTMRLLAEEKRTGTLEVLLTAPVNEIPVVASKFLGTWIFFMLCWVPAGLFLIALRTVGDAPFDYRPMIGFYLALAAQGAMFLAMGLFFSALTRDQIVSAVLTFAVLLVLLAFAFLRRQPLLLDLPDALLAVANRLSFYHTWLESLSGQLPVRNLLLALSLTVFWLFLATKVLETRKWN